MSPIHPCLLTSGLFFIDNSNLFHNLTDLKKIDPQWIRLYDPLHLAKRLAGSRTLVYVGFYCTRPPGYLLEDGPEAERRYTAAMKYYAAAVPWDTPGTLA